MARPTVLAYHFPQWHVDGRNERWHGRGWTEWKLVEANRPRFPGHRPLMPAWGCHDEADPAQMAREIDLAADHSVDGFLFDTYWYEDGPFLDRAITEGFLRAPNRKRVRMACMWANHTWRNWHPTQATQRPWQDALLVPGAVSVESWRRFARIVARWMALPEYLRLGDRPFFQIYEVRPFVEGCGGIDRAAEELAWFRELVKREAGAEPHVSCVCNRLGDHGIGARELCRQLGLESIGPYNQFDHHDAGRCDFPVGNWAEVDATNRRHWQATDSYTGLPYIPSLSVGWDVSGRACVTDTWEKREYPWMPMLLPDAARWGRELRALREWFEATPAAFPLVTLNAWNEWTEGAVLLPTTEHGAAILESLRDSWGDWR